MFRRRIELLSLISNPNGTSRIELARATGRSPAKIGKLVQEWVTAGILEEERPIETSRGRKPMLLRPSRSLGFLLGVDIGMENLRIVVADMHGIVVGSSQAKSNAKSQVENALRGIFAAADAVLEKSNISRHKLLAVGVSHSGGIDPKTGSCLYWHEAMHWKDVPIKSIFSEHYGVPCYVDDSPHCMALAEKVFGAAMGDDTFIFINIGHGIGSGLFIEGELYRGATGIAGELGHTTILPDGPRCSCGNRGCLEALASGKAMIDAASSAVGENITTSLQEAAADDPGTITVEQISSAARSGDRFASRIVNRTGSCVGSAVANLINLFDPPLIVLGGGVVAAGGDFLLETIIREASVSAFEVAFAKMRIVRSPLDSLAAARGATLMVARAALEKSLHRDLAATA